MRVRLSDLKNRKRDNEVNADVAEFVKDFQGGKEMNGDSNHSNDGNVGLSNVHIDHGYTSFTVKNPEDKPTTSNFQHDDTDGIDDISDSTKPSRFKEELRKPKQTSSIGLMTENGRRLFPIYRISSSALLNVLKSKSGAFSSAMLNGLKIQKEASKQDITWQKTPYVSDDIWLKIKNAPVQNIEKPKTRNKYLVDDGESIAAPVAKGLDPEISSLNADSIQEVFQNMLNMTSLAPMQDLDQDIGAQTETNAIVKPAEEVSGQMLKQETAHNIRLVTTSTVLDKSDLPTKSEETVKQENDTKAPDSSNKSSESSDCPTTTVDKTEEKSSNATEDVKADQGMVDFEPNINDPKLMKHKSEKKKKKGEKITYSKDHTVQASHRKPYQHTNKLKIANHLSQRSYSNYGTAKLGRANDEAWKLSLKEAYNTNNGCSAVLRFTADLLVHRWKQYLLMTSEEVNNIAVAHARRANMTEDAVEMLENRDSSVWSIINDLRFI